MLHDACFILLSSQRCQFNNKMQSFNPFTADFISNFDYFYIYSIFKSHEVLANVPSNHIYRKY